jgi:hypothetical protein
MADFADGMTEQENRIAEGRERKLTPLKECVCWTCGWYPAKCGGLERRCVENDYVSYKGR